MVFVWKKYAPGLVAAVGYLVHIVGDVAEQIVVPLYLWKVYVKDKSFDDELADESGLAAPSGELEFFL